MEVRLQRNINKSLDTLGTQLSETVDKIIKAQDQIDQVDQIQKAQIESLQPPMPQYDLGLDQRTPVPQYKSPVDPFVTDQKPDDPPPGYMAKGNTMEEIMARIKEVWPKVDVYIKKGSAGTPNALQCSGDAKNVPSPESAKATGFHPEEDLSKSRGRSRARRGKSGRNDSKSPSSDRSLSPLHSKMQFFSGDPSKGSWSSFIIKFEITADRHKRGEDKKLDRLFGCLNDKALVYASNAKTTETMTA